MAKNGDGNERLVTLIIPTVHHRAKLFGRVLGYLSACGFRCPIVVSDHSPPEEVGVIAEIARGHGNLDLRLLQHSPDIHFLERLALCATAAETPYVHLHADDDFIVRPALGRLVGEIDGRPDCAAVMGINLHADFASRDLTMAPKTAIEMGEPFARLTAQLESYSSVLYALRRRDEFIASVSFAVERCPDVQFWQYLESCVAVLSGTIAVLEELHYVRERHAAKWSATLVREKSRDHFPYLILSPEFHPRVAAFRAALIEACRQRAIPIDDGALDDGLIHLLFRGFGTMGLPAKRIAIEDAKPELAARFWKRVSDEADPATVELKRMFAIVRG